MTEKGRWSEVPEQEEYLEAKDGTQIFMRSWVPQGEIEHVVLAVHGVVIASGVHRRMALALSEQKIATFGIDLRGFGNTGTRDEAEDFHLVIEDITMALNEVQARYPGLPVSLLGLSMGAALILNAFGQGEPDPATLILLASRVKSPEPVKDMLRGLAFFAKRFFVPDAKFDFWRVAPKAMRESETGQLIEADEQCTKQLSIRMLMGMGAFLRWKPILQGTARVGVPTLLIHGEADTTGPPAGSRQVYENLTVSQKKLVMIPDMEHDLDDLSVYKGPGLHKPLTPNATRVIEEIVAWLRAHQAG